MYMFLSNLSISTYCSVNKKRWSSHEFGPLRLRSNGGSSEELIINTIILNFSCKSQCQLSFPLIVHILWNVEVSNCLSIFSNHLGELLLTLCDVPENHSDCVKI